MGLPITASCDTAWNRTRVSVMMPLALRCRVLDRCASWAPRIWAQIRSPLSSWDRTHILCLFFIYCSMQSFRYWHLPLISQVCLVHQKSIGVLCLAKLSVQELIAHKDNQQVRQLAGHIWTQSILQTKNTVQDIALQCRETFHKVIFQMK